MCTFASFILTKTGEFWSEISNSHEVIIYENNLEQLDGVNPELVRVEIIPDKSSKEDLSTWEYKLDQDVLPEWTFHGDPELEKRARKALCCRAKKEKWFKKATGHNVSVGFGGTASAGDYGKASAGNRGTAIAGDCGTAIAGDYGKASAGFGGVASAGDEGTVSAGDYGKASAGNGGVASSGDYGKANAGNYGKANAGEYGEASAGKYGKASVGNYGKAIAGDCGKVSAGNGGVAIAGNRGVASAGNRGTASAGKNGSISIRWYDHKSKRYRVAVGYVGEDEIKANTPYHVVDGKLVEKK